jgi:hypothetical protein
MILGAESRKVKTMSSRTLGNIFPNPKDRTCVMKRGYDLAKDREQPNPATKSSALPNDHKEIKQPLVEHAALSLEKQPSPPVRGRRKILSLEEWPPLSVNRNIRREH